MQVDCVAPETPRVVDAAEHQPLRPAYFLGGMREGVGVSVSVFCHLDKGYDTGNQYAQGCPCSKVSASALTCVCCPCPPSVLLF